LIDIPHRSREGVAALPGQIEIFDDIGWSDVRSVNLLQVKVLVNYLECPQPFFEFHSFLSAVRKSVRLDHVHLPAGPEISYHEGVGDLDYLFQAAPQYYRFGGGIRVDGTSIELILTPRSSDTDTGGFIVDPVGVTDVHLSTIIKIRGSDLHGPHSYLLNSDLSSVLQ
jgi:hypothetical protein